MAFSKRPSRLMKGYIAAAWGRSCEGERSTGRPATSWACHHTFIYRTFLTMRYLRDSHSQAPDTNPINCLQRVGALGWLLTLSSARRQAGRRTLSEHLLMPLLHLRGQARPPPATIRTERNAVRKSPPRQGPFHTPFLKVEAESFKTL